MIRKLQLRRLATEPDPEREPACHSPIQVEHLCRAVDELPGARIGIWQPDRPLSATGGRVTAEVQLGVELYDPVLEEWRLLLALVDGKAIVDQADVEDLQGVAARAVNDLARLLDACVVTREGVVLIVGPPSPDRGD